MTRQAGLTFVDCHYCDGSGEMPSGDSCEVCEGTGEVEARCSSCGFEASLCECCPAPPESGMRINLLEVGDGDADTDQ